MRSVIASFLVLGVVVLGTFAQTAPADGQSHPAPIFRIRVSEAVLDGIVLKRSLPQPPWNSDNSHQKGVVTIAVIVDYDGNAKRTKPISGDSVLTDVAMRAIQQWHYRPFIVHGQPYEVESRVTMKFDKKHATVVVGER